MVVQLAVSADEVAAGEIRHALNVGFWLSMLGPPCDDVSMQFANVSGVTCGFAMMPSGQCENCFRTTSNLCGNGPVPPPQDLTFTDISLPEGTRFAMDVDDDYIENYLFVKGFTGQKRNLVR